MRGKDKTWSGLGPAPNEAIGFFDRERELNRIREAFRKKESMMISGPADIGKTALMKKVVGCLPSHVGRRCLYLESFKSLQDLLRKLLRTLDQTGNPALRRQLRAEGVSRHRFDAWIKAMPSPRLKGALYRAVEKGDYRVILDQVPPLTHAVAKVIKELFWMRGTPVYLFMRDGPENMIPFLGRFFYWGDRERLVLGPLPAPVAARMLERCIQHFGLADFNPHQFSKEVLELSRGVPGAIVKMCALAADPRYQCGSRVKTKLVHIDYLMSGSRPQHSRGIVGSSQGFPWKE